MVTINDIAERAGLAVGTVSRILNNRGYISEKSKQKVDQAMADLHYQPNAIARSLSKKSSTLIGVIIPLLEHPYFSLLVSEIEIQLRAKGYQIIVMVSYSDEKIEDKLFNNCLMNRVDAIIMCSGNVSTQKFETNDIPVINIERYNDSGITTLMCDNYMGGTLATEHLIEKGCKNLLCLGGLAQANMPADERVKAFIDVAKKHGVQYNLESATYATFQEMNYQSSIDEAFELYRHVDGIVCTSDVQAMQIISYLKRQGVLVPSQVKVVGFDDTPICQWGSPTITSVKQPVKEMVHAIIESLQLYKEKQIVPKEQIFPVTLIERESTR